MKSINTILIANRGEIASRVIRTCKKMGITSVAVYADADKNAPFVRQADLAVHIGASEPLQSYLDQNKIITAAKRTGADAIHPGYGFLSENADFARLCKTEGIIFIGPNPEAIAAMGSKSKAKIMMKQAGVPVVPGYDGEDQSEATLKAEALKIGFPVLLKATAGGGGKGMRIVHEEKEIAVAIASAKREAKNAFGDDELLIEKYIASGRHIEFQIFGDQHKNVIHLLERECSIQRRYQKVIEESPSPIMTEALRKSMGDAAVLAAQAMDYDNAGTVEFIYDDISGAFYFLEVNTRLQVEHPVTEAITGLDLVQMQVQSAQGIPLQINQEEVIGNGYAIEARLYAEDAANNYAPVTGKIHNYQFPDVDGLRVESAIESGSEISIFYDPMIAKIIVKDTNRTNAHTKLLYVFQQLVCQGVVTNLPFLKTLLQHEEFRRGNYNTHFVQEKIDLSQINKISDQHIQEVAIVATLYDWNKREQSRKILRSLPSGWRNNCYQYQKEVFHIGEQVVQLQYQYVEDGFVFLFEDKERKVAMISIDETTLCIDIDGLRKTYTVVQAGEDYFMHSPTIGNVKITQEDRFPIKEKEKVSGGYESPIPSQVVKINIQSGDVIKEGDPLIILSSMKMENVLVANQDGKVEKIYVAEGQNVEAGFLLLKINEE